MLAQVHFKRRSSHWTLGTGDTIVVCISSANETSYLESKSNWANTQWIQRASAFKERRAIQHRYPNTLTHYQRPSTTARRKWLRQHNTYHLLDIGGGGGSCSSRSNGRTMEKVEASNVRPTIRSGLTKWAKEQIWRHYRCFSARQWVRPTLWDCLHDSECDWSGATGVRFVRPPISLCRPMRPERASAGAHWNRPAFCSHFVVRHRTDKVNQAKLNTWVVSHALARLTSIFVVADSLECGGRVRREWARLTDSKCTVEKLVPLCHRRPSSWSHCKT